MCATDERKKSMLAGIPLTSQGWVKCRKTLHSRGTLIGSRITKLDEIKMEKGACIRKEVITYSAETSRSGEPTNS